MRFSIVLISFLTLLLSTSCKNQSAENKSNSIYDSIAHPIIGTWIKIGPTGPTTFTFNKDGFVSGDLGNDGTIDVVASFEIQNDTISFFDKEGMACPDFGVYKMYKSEHYTSFDLISDDCGGRIKTTMGIWTRTDFNKTLNILNDKLAKKPELSDYLERARVYMALGDVAKAKADFDVYIKSNSTDARAYVNRAGTQFPNDLEGVIADCNAAIELDGSNKNGYFLRGLARYELGEKEQACADFEKAIDLGFSILRIAEENRCAEYWNKKDATNRK